MVAAGRGWLDCAPAWWRRHDGCSGHLMRLLIATDAWQPQVNGVVRTLGALSRRLLGLGATVSFVTPEGFPSFPVPTYPDLRCALPSRREVARRIDEAKPDV